MTSKFKVSVFMMVIFNGKMVLEEFNHLVKGIADIIGHRDGIGGGKIKDHIEGIRDPKNHRVESEENTEEGDLKKKLKDVIMGDMLRKADIEIEVIEDIREEFIDIEIEMGIEEVIEKIITDIEFVNLKDDPSKDPI